MSPPSYSHFSAPSLCLSVSRSFERRRAARPGGCGPSAVIGGSAVVGFLSEEVAAAAAAAEAVIDPVDGGSGQSGGRRPPPPTLSHPADSSMKSRAAQNRMSFRKGAPSGARVNSQLNHNCSLSRLSALNLTLAFH